ncbi:MAG: zf-HC2 domain-containing protein [Thermoleophilia bacterium]
MNHERARELLPLLLEMRAADPAEAELRAHVDGCAECRARLERLRRVETALTAAGPDGDMPGPALAHRVLEVPLTHPRRPAGRFRRGVLPVGAAVAVAASLAAAVLVVRGDDRGAPAGFAAQRTMALSGRAQGTVQLGRPNGSARVVRIDLHHLPTAGTPSFDVWAVGPDGAVRVGSLGPDRDGNCVAEFMTSAAVRVDRVAVTRPGMGPAHGVMASTRQAG